MELSSCPVPDAGAGWEGGSEMDVKQPRSLASIPAPRQQGSQLFAHLDSLLVVRQDARSCTGRGLTKITLEEEKKLSLLLGV